APLIGSLLMIFMPWQGIYYVVTGLLIFILISYLKKIPETIDPEKKQPLNTLRILRNYISILKTPPSVALIFAITALEIVAISIPSLLPAVLIVDYHISPTYSSILLGSSIVAIMCGMLSNQYLVGRGVAINLVWRYFSLFLLLSIVFNLFLVLTQTINPVLLLLNIAVNGFFVGALNSTMYSVYLMRYGHITGTALSLLLSLMLILSGIILAPVAHFSRFGGLTLVSVIGIAAFLVALINLSYQRIWGIDEEQAANTPGGH
ncbi:MFS transporter, partial [Psittacicella gerlachiana]